MANGEGGQWEGGKRGGGELEGGELEGGDREGGESGHTGGIIRPIPANFDLKIF